MDGLGRPVIFNVFHLHCRGDCIEKGFMLSCVAYVERWYNGFLVI